MKLRLAALITAVLTCVSVVVGIGLSATPAYAQQNEVCTVSIGGLAESPCLNAWNGGPYLETYSPGASNEDFQLQTVDRNGTIYSQIKYLPYGTCVGDGNGGSSTDARAVMTDACNGANGYGGSYGTLFLLEPGGCVFGWGLYNVHWGGYLNYAGFPNNVGNGVPWYLNNPDASYCLDYFA
jgi:hypothetical protein